MRKKKARRKQTLSRGFSFVRAASLKEDAGMYSFGQRPLQETEGWHLALQDMLSRSRMAGFLIRFHVKKTHLRC